MSKQPRYTTQPTVTLDEVIDSILTLDDLTLRNTSPSHTFDRTVPPDHPTNVLILTVSLYSEAREKPSFISSMSMVTRGELQEVWGVGSSLGEDDIRLSLPRSIWKLDAPLQARYARQLAGFASRLGSSQTKADILANTRAIESALTVDDRVEHHETMWGRDPSVPGTDDCQSEGREDAVNRRTFHTETDLEAPRGAALPLREAEASGIFSFSGLDFDPDTSMSPEVQVSPITRAHGVSHLTQLPRTSAPISTPSPSFSSPSHLPPSPSPICSRCRISDLLCEPQLSGSACQPCARAKVKCSFSIDPGSHPRAARFGEAYTLMHDLLLDRELALGVKDEEGWKQLKYLSVFGDINRWDWRNKEAAWTTLKDEDREWDDHEEQEEQDDQEEREEQDGQVDQEEGGIELTGNTISDRRKKWTRTVNRIKVLLDFSVD